MLKTNATMVFASYDVQDEGIQLHFVCPDPGGGEASDYSCLLTDAELASITTLAELKALAKTKLERKLRAATIATKLDPLIGQSLVV